MRALLCCCSGLALALAFAAPPAAGITLLQTDDFQGGTTQGWGGGASATNIATGGPAGAGDRFLRISSNNNNLGTNNTVQWTGDYIAAGVGKLNFQLNNLGSTPLALRIAVFGPGGRFTTTNETVLPPGSGWVSVDFVLDSASLTQTAGFGTLADTLAAVDTLLLRHDPDPISPSGEQNPVTGTLGIDNITALPEPGSPLLLIAGISALGLLYRFDRYVTGHGRAARATAPSWRGERSALAKRGVSS
jgi:hypothetical protein